MDFLNILKYLGVSTIKNNWLWETWARPKSGNYENVEFSDVPRVKQKSYQSEMKQYNST